MGGIDYAPGIEHLVFFQIHKRLLNIFPTRILGQNGTSHDFEGRIPRPPVLVSILLVEYSQQPVDF